MSYALRAFIVMFGVLVAGSGSAEQKPEPLVVLMQWNPYYTLPFGRSRVPPTFAFYSDGSVIFRDFGDATNAYDHIRLDEVRQKKLLASIAPEAVLDLNKQYILSEWSHQTVNELFVWVDGKRKHVLIYGDISADQKVRAKTPAGFLRVFESIWSFMQIVPNASPWLPKRVEVVMRPFEHPLIEPVSWPEGWPSLESTTPIGSTGNRRLILPVTELSNVQRLVEALKPKRPLALLPESKLMPLEQLIEELKPKTRPMRAIEFRGQTWKIFYRFPFPNEERWVD